MNHIPCLKVHSLFSSDFMIRFELDDEIDRSIESNGYNIIILKNNAEHKTGILAAI